MIRLHGLNAWERARVLVMVAVAVALLWPASNATALTFNADDEQQKTQPMTELEAAVAAKVTQSDLLLQQFKKSGQARVIINLNSDELPKSATESAPAEARYQVALAQLQTDVLATLSVPGQTNTKQFRLIPALVAEITEQDILTLAADPRVGMIEIDELSAPTLADSTRVIGADAAWASGVTGTGWNVAILDTGIDADHSAFAGRIVEESCFSSTYLADNSRSICPNDVSESIGPGSADACEADLNCSHGSHVAGISAGHDNTIKGVAPDAGILAVQVFSRFDNANYCGSAEPCVLSYRSDQLRALEHVYYARHQYPVAAINMSLGGGGYTSYCDAISPTFVYMLEQLRDVGIATVIAAGNDGYTNAISAPACFSPAISVGSTANNNQNSPPVDSVSSFSNSAHYLDVLAPGHFIYSAVDDGGYAYYAGTSMAAPHVAGCYALFRSAGYDFGVEALLDVLKYTGQLVYDHRNGIVKPRVNCGDVLTVLAEASPILAPGALRALERTQDSVTFGWESALNAGAYELRLFQTMLPGTPPVVVNLAATETSYQFTGLIPNTLYRLAIRSIDANDSSKLSSYSMVTIATRATESLAEAVDYPSLYLENYWSIKPWSITNEFKTAGDTAAQSPELEDSQGSYVWGQIAGPGTLTFDYKVSSELNWDFFLFSMNNEIVVEASGEVDWTTVTVELEEGANYFWWEYLKDVSFSDGSDSAWVDNIRVERTSGFYQVEVNPGSGALFVSTDSFGEYCVGDAYDFHCHYSVPAGESITLERYDDYNFSVFTEWGDACADQQGPTCTLVVNSDLKVSASWRDEVSFYPLTASSSGNGTVEVLTDQVAYGDSGYVQFTPAAGYQFAGVTADTCSGTVIGNSYRTNALYEACHLEVSFSQIMHRIDSRFTDDVGTLVPYAYWAMPGEVVTFDYQMQNPLAHYITGVHGCGASLQGEQIVTAPITSECLIEVSAEPYLYSVQFDLGSYGVRTGGGQLEQSIPYGEDAEEPIIEVHPAFVFSHWSAEFIDVWGDVTVVAVYQQVNEDIDAYQDVQFTVREGNEVVFEQLYPTAWGQSAVISPPSGMRVSRRVEGTCGTGSWVDQSYRTGIIFQPCEVIMTASKARKSSILPLIIDTLERQQQQAEPQKDDNDGSQ